MRRFRFVGDPNMFDWDQKPVVGDVYPETHYGTKDGVPFDSIFGLGIVTEDWQEVFDEPKPLHKDTDLGMFTLGIINGTISNQLMVDSMSDQSRQFLVENAILLAKELIKQLNEETK